MRLPSKTTPYKQSTLSQFLPILALLEKSPMTPKTLYQALEKNFLNVAEFIETLNSLYALRKIEMRGEKLFYVG